MASSHPAADVGCGRQGEADRHGQRHRDPACVQRPLGDRDAQALGDRGRLAPVQRPAHDQELLAAPSGDQVAGAAHGREPLRDLDQNRVTCTVAVTIVAAFEVVHVDQEDDVPQRR